MFSGAAAAPSPDNALRNLAGAGLVFRLGLARAEVLEEALAASFSRPDISAVAVLRAQGAIDASAAALIEELAESYLKLHQGRPWTELLGGAANQRLLGLLVQHKGLMALLAQSELSNSVLDGKPTDDAFSDALWRTEVAGYQDKQFHCQGGLGDIFKAFDPRLRRLVAIKQIRQDSAGHPETKLRFLQEARTIAQLAHRHIVPVYRIGVDADGLPYYVMPFLAGRTLHQRIEDLYSRRSALASSEYLSELRILVKHLVEVCGAVEHAHSNGILHRDLKPANVMVTDAGDTFLLDWGLAKRIWLGPRDELAAELASPTALGEEGFHTQQGTLAGTLPYMSTEQAQGDIESLAPQTDIYGLGACLYEIVTGSFPLKGKSREEIERRVAQGQIPRPKRLNADCPPPLEAICLQGMAQRKGNRYATAADLASDLQRWLGDAPVVAYRESAGDRLGRILRRHPRLVAAGMAAAIALLGTTSWGILERSRARSNAARNQSLTGQLDKLGRVNEQIGADAGRLAAQLKKARSSADAAARQRDEFSGQLTALQERAGKQDEELYRLRMPVVQALRDQNRMDEARRLLDELASRQLSESTPEQTARPNWEWRYLDAHLDDSDRTITRAAAIDSPLAVCPTGDRVAFIDHDGAVHVWRPGAVKTISATPLASAARALKWGPDQRLAVTTTDDHLQVWRANDDELVPGPSTQRRPALTTAFWSRDRLLWLERASDAIELFQEADEVGVPAPSALSRAAILRSGLERDEVVGVTSDNELFTWAPGREQATVLVRPVDPIMDVVGLPKSNRFLLLFSDRLELWDGSRSQAQHVIKRLDFTARTVAIDATGGWIAVGGAPGRLCCWPADNAELSRKLDGATGTILALAWAVDEHGAAWLLANCGDEPPPPSAPAGNATSKGTVKAWNLANLVSAEPCAAVDVRQPLAARFAGKNGPLKVVAADGDITGIDFGGPTSAQRIASLGTSVAAAAWNHDGSQLAVLSDTAVQRVSSTGKPLQQVALDTNAAPLSLAWVGDSRVLLAMSDRAALLNFDDPAAHQSRDAFRGARLLSSATNPTRIAAIESDAELLFCDDSAEPRAKTRAVGGRVVGMAWHPTEDRLATVTSSGILSIWSPTGIAPLLSLSAEVGEPRLVAWSDDGDKLAVIGDRVRVFAASRLGAEQVTR